MKICEQKFTVVQDINSLSRSIYGHKWRPANSGAISRLDFLAVHTVVHHFVCPSRSDYKVHDDGNFTVFAERSDNFEPTDGSIICAPWCTQTFDKHQICCSRCSAVCIVTRLQAGGPAFESEQEHDVFLFSKTSRPVVGPSQRPIQWLPGGGGGLFRK
jgi:hypothetical protein